MGALRMKALLAELEEIGRSEELGAAPERISRVEEEFGRVRAALEDSVKRCISARLLGARSLAQGQQGDMSFPTLSSVEEADQACLGDLPNGVLRARP